MKIQSKKAFTLVELIITISVMAILAVGIFVATKPQKRIGETNDAKRKNDAQVIEQSIKVMAADGGVMPSELKNLTENIAFAIVKAGGLVSGTYTCTALGSDISKKDISASLLTVIPVMPMDPDLASSSNETGYYIVRRGSSYDVEPCNTYRIAATTGSKQMCGDRYCGSTESCSSCPQDCGACYVAQSYTVGPNSPQLAVNYGTEPYAWNNPNRVYANDTSYAEIATSLDEAPIENDINIIKADGSIGTTNKASFTNWRTTPEPDYMGDDWATVANPGYTTYGGEGDLWGENWTAADINDVDFGVAIRLKKVQPTYTQLTNYLKISNFGFNIPTGATITGIKMEMERWVYNFSNYEPYQYVDHVRITVYYTN
jgi:prepilin-type N-terminal cleavage/methylation domain-containing protein